MQRVFDGHNDVLLRLWQADDHAGRRFLDGDGAGHIDLPRARAGGLAGGFFAVESPDGRWAYFARYVGAGLWRVPVQGGEESAVLPALEDGEWGHWWPAAGGVYFVAPGPDGTPLLAFHDLATAESRTVAVLSRWPESPGLSISPDGRRVLLAQVDRVESDLMLVEP